MSDAFYPGQTDYLHKLSEMWVMFEDAIENATGPQGWSPSLAIVADGDRQVMQLVDWIGGEGTKPTLTGYLGTTGIVADIEDAVDLRGPAGAGGGVSTLAALTDVALASVTDKQVLMYNTATSKWINAVAPEPANYKDPAAIVGMALTPNHMGFIQAVGTNNYRSLSSNLYTKGSLSTPTGKWVDSIVVQATGGGGVTGINLGDVEGITASIVLNSVGAVVSFVASSLRFAQSLTLGTTARLTTLTLPELIAVGTSTNFVANSISLPKLEVVGGSSTFDAPSVNVPELTYAPLMTGMCSYTGGAVTISAPKLEIVGALSYGSINTTTHNYPALKHVFNAITIGHTNVTTVSFPLLEFVGLHVGNFNSCLNISGNNITSLSLPSLKQVGKDGLNQTFSVTSPINQASVDGILVKLASLDGTNGYEAFSTRTINLNGASTAAPSATGLTAKATLVARGCTVNHN